MFGLTDLLSLIVSAFIIWPLVVFIRESGYLIMSELVGAENPRLTIGSGPRFFKVGIFDFRKYYHLQSWFSYDSLKRKSKFAYVMVYAGPIIILLAAALVINAMLANNMLQTFPKFWDRFMFYAVFYLLLDTIPMKTVNGMPNNGMIIYEMLRYGKRTDYNHEPFIPATTEVEEEYQEKVKEVEEKKEEEKEEAAEGKGDKNEEMKEIEEEKQDEKQELTEDKNEKKDEIKKIRKTPEHEPDSPGSFGTGAIVHL
ncbi:hypothetical protein [Indiicoccus explosivorum]|uniref:hypothetical protein n=1 Tax=Indiicoccus explosivorum TaxID=1917864 RepID=UPI000B450380|nr:hypothetical protein [Indiicoccus explosivorum]